MSSLPESIPVPASLADHGLLRHAAQAALAGGEVLLRFEREGFALREKATSDLVTDADRESERVILDLLRANCPGHDFLAEESQAHATEEHIPEHLWIVDPLDGTTNFAHGIPHYAVSIAYYHNGEPQVGVVYNPARADWYFAVKGHGAWCGQQQLHVGQQEDLSECLIGVGFYYDRGAMMEATLATIHELFKTGIHGIRRFGTAALDMAHVASGYYAAYVEYQLSPWDFAAGRLLVEEAGGRVTSALGDGPLPLKKGSVLATNGKLHPTMQKIIGETARHLFE